jgi:hypothetical protein
VFRRNLALFVLLCLTSAIDCYHFLNADQVITPAPVDGCVAAALDSAPQVARVKWRKHMSGLEGFELTLNDSTARHHRREVALGYRTSNAQSGELGLSTTWALLDKPSPAERQSIANLAAGLLRYLSERCGTGEPTPVTCRFDREALEC